MDKDEADLTREDIALAISRDEPRSPRLPLFSSGDPDLAANFDELLTGLGERNGGDHEQAKEYAARHPSA